MPGKAGLVEMESGSGTRGYQPAEEAKDFERRDKCKRQLVARQLLVEA
jgi:hypothetical protein